MIVLPDPIHSAYSPEAWYETQKWETEKTATFDIFSLLYSINNNE